MTVRAENVWAKSVDVLKTKLDPQIFSAWIKPLSLSELVVPDSETNQNMPRLELSAPNKFCCDHVERHYSGIISTALRDVTGLPNFQLRFKVGNLTITKPVFHKNGSQSMSQQNMTTAAEALNKVLEKPFYGKDGNSVGQPTVRRVARPRVVVSHDDSKLNPKYNFSNFIVGTCNQFAHAVCLRVSQNLGATYNPLFIYGGVGLGKTHLANAIGNTSKRQGKNVLLVSSETFVNEVIAALRGNKMPQFKARFRSLDLLIVDDIQFLIGKERTQEEFFHTFNELHQRHRQIVITSDKTPQELIGLEERLRTRFASGISVDLQAPDLETRVAILTKKAESSGVELPADVAEHVATRVSTNVRELEGALNRLLALSSLQTRPLNIALAEEVLGGFPLGKIRDISVELIQRTVAEKYNVSIGDLLGKRRTQNIAGARHIAMFLCRRLTPCSYPEIGSSFGGRDHSTVIHAYRVIEERFNSNEIFKSEIASLEKKLGS